MNWRARSMAGRRIELPPAALLAVVLAFQPEQFLNIELPLPHFDDQLRIVEILKKQAPLKAKHSAIRQANAALLPATLERVFS